MKINIINQLKTLDLSICLLLGVPILVFINGNEFDIIVFVIMLVFLIPPFILYLQYLYYSLNVLIDLDYTKKIITYKKKHKTEGMSFKSIVSIEKVCSFPEAEQRIRWLSTDSFFYFQINLDNNEKIIIPCFITMELNIPNIEQVIKPRFIAYIR